MKKSLIALAALSTIAGSVAAQSSSVTIYGRINPGYAQSESTTAAGIKTETFGYQANGWTSPRLGLNIVEDMGQGTSAIGTWETNIATEGSSVSTVRQAFAGIKGGFGTVTIGNQYLPEYTQGITVAGTVNSVGFGGAAMAVQTTGTSVHRLGTVDSANSVTFVAPKMGNVTLTALVGKSTNDVTAADGSKTTDTNSSVLGLSANYAAGNLNTTLSYSESKADNIAGTTTAAISSASSCTASSTVLCGAANSAGTGYYVKTTLTPVAAADTKQKNWTANATYTLGDAKLFAYYADREMSGTTILDFKGYNVGATYTIGKVTPFAQYSAGKMKETAAKTLANDVSSYQVGATYAFSKRTTGYAYVAQYKDDAATSTDVKKSEVTSVGIAHNF